MGGGTGTGPFERDSMYAIEAELREVGYIAHAKVIPIGGRVEIGMRNDNGKYSIGLINIIKLNDDSKFKEKWVVRTYNETDGQMIKGSIMGLKPCYRALVEREILDKNKWM
jgi:hypothetical protein